jgi:hypothetical protein
MPLPHPLPRAIDICREVDPPAFVTNEGTTVYCYLHTSGPALGGAALTTLRQAPPQLD